MKRYMLKIFMLAAICIFFELCGCSFVCHNKDFDRENSDSTGILRIKQPQLLLNNSESAERVLGGDSFTMDLSLNKTPIEEALKQVCDNYQKFNDKRFDIKWFVVRDCERSENTGDVSMHLKNKSLEEILYYIASSAHYYCILVRDGKSLTVIVEDAGTMMLHMTRKAAGISLVTPAGLAEMAIAGKDVADLSSWFNRLGMNISSDAAVTYYKKYKGGPDLILFKDVKENELKMMQSIITLLDRGAHISRLEQRQLIPAKAVNDQIAINISPLKGLFTPGVPSLAAYGQKTFDIEIKNSSFRRALEEVFEKYRDANPEAPELKWIIIDGENKRAEPIYITTVLKKISLEDALNSLIAACRFNYLLISGEKPVLVLFRDDTLRMLESPVISICQVNEEIIRKMGYMLEDNTADLSYWFKECGVEMNQKCKAIYYKRLAGYSNILILSNTSLKEIEAMETAIALLQHDFHLSLTH